MPVSPFQRAVQTTSNTITQTANRGWETPEEIKPDIVDEMIRIILDCEMKSKDRIAAFNALRVADQSQWERNNPDLSGKSKGSPSVNINMNIAAAAVVREMIERGELGSIEEMRTLAQPSPSDNSR